MIKVRVRAKSESGDENREVLTDVNESVTKTEKYVLMQSGSGDENRGVEVCT